MLQYTSIYAFLDEIALCIAMKNGITLSGILKQAFANYSWKNRLASELSTMGFNGSTSGSCAMAIRNQLLGVKLLSSEEPLWNDLLSYYLSAILMSRRFTDVSESVVAKGIFEEHLQAVQIAYRIFGASVGTKWLLPVIYVVNERLWALATSDAQKEECARQVNRCVTICLTDRSPLPESRKWGAYRSLALLFRIYFHLEQLNLCTNALRAMGNADLPDSSRYPRGAVVAFKYWLGRFYFVNEQWDAAEDELWWSWSHCHPEAFGNKRRILELLIPLQIHNKHRYPSVALLDRYTLGCQPILRALRLGDIQSYRNQLQDNERILLRQGTFLLWERLQLLVLRNLLWRSYRLLGGPSRLGLREHLLPLQNMIGGDAEELEWMVATLISQGFLKGYIHQEKAILVLSLKEPFPLISK
jgi:hypothetical protein